ncbi:MAG: pantetheine-phosphate adenylyltransferase [[Clostridium] innocuum]
MKAAIFPGSFDPVTLGHLDIIERASRMFDRLIVVILENSEKHATFSIEERLTFLRSNTAHLSNVEVAADHGLTVDFARKQEAVAIVRGVRSVKDYEYELDIASVNQHIAPEVETVLLYASPKFSYVSSSIIRELVKYGQDISAYVPKDVTEAFVNR